MQTTPQIICDIIKRGMKLDAEQIWIYNQRREIPNDRRLYVVVGVMGIKAYASNNRPSYSDETELFTDNLSQYVQESISINIFSYTPEALQRYNEAIGSLKSTYSIQKQEAMGLKIAQIPFSVADTSMIEGAAQLYRVTISLNVLRKYDMILESDYYDTFEPAEIDKTQA